MVQIVYTTLYSITRFFDRFTALLMEFFTRCCIASFNNFFTTNIETTVTMRAVGIGTSLRKGFILCHYLFKLFMEHSLVRADFRELMLLLIYRHFNFIVLRKVRFLNLLIFFNLSCIVNYLCFFISDELL